MLRNKCPSELSSGGFFAPIFKNKLAPQGEILYNIQNQGSLVERELAPKATEGLLSQICDCPMSPTAPSFPSCRKRRGRKGALGCVWCFLPLILGKSQCFRRRSTRYSPYGYRTTRRLIRHTRFAASCLRTIAVNRRRSGDPDNLYLLAGSVHPRLPLSRGAGAERRRG